VQYLRGVGPARAGLLGRLGIQTVRDLLLHLPRRHEDRRNPTPLFGLREGIEQAAIARINLDIEPPPALLRAIEKGNEDILNLHLVKI